MTFLFDPHYQAEDTSGLPYSGAKLTFYQAGTTTPITTYQDYAKGADHLNPVVADTAGRFAPIWVDTSPFKWVLTTSSGSVIQTVDHVYVPGFPGTAFTPQTDDGNALGTTSLRWSDLFLASGGVVNWNAGDVTITHSANTLAFAGASNGYAFDAKVTVTGQLIGKGTGTNDDATAGQLGEYIEAVVASGSAVSLTTTAAKTVTSITLTAGDWDLEGFVYFRPGGSTSLTILSPSISATTDTADLGVGNSLIQRFDAFVPGSDVGGNALGPIRKSLTADTTFYLVAQATFTVSTMTAFGTLRARRIR